MKVLFILPLLALAACDTFEQQPIVEGPVPLARTTPTAMGQRVFVKPTLVATPQRVVEDSRCPPVVQCVTAGRLIVEARIDGVDYVQTALFTLGEPTWVRDSWVTMVTAMPEARSGLPMQPEDYRFTFSAQPLQTLAE